ncbi:hypothetical protein ACE4RR_12200 [Alteribacillus sp. HJP-4]
MRRSEEKYAGKDSKKPLWKLEYNFQAKAGIPSDSDRLGNKRDPLPRRDTDK